jgi:hypothetical protein
MEDGLDSTYYTHIHLDIFIYIQWVSMLLLCSGHPDTRSPTGFFSRDAEDDVQVSASFPDSNPFGRMSITYQTIR